LQKLRRAVAGSRLPVIAIGGIVADRAGAVRDAGASGVAVVSAILGAADARQAAAALRRKFAVARPRGKP
jgi:thiamine monophosphate synthase